MEKFSTICNVPIRYACFGKGEQVIVLLHGYLEAMEVWEQFAGLMGKKYKIVTLDLPACGWSGYKTEVVTMDFMADVAADVIKELGIEKAVVVGHSMGGYVAISLAQRYENMVEKLVLLHSTPNADSNEKIEDRKREINLVKEGKKEILAKINPARGFAQCNVKKCEDMIEELYEQVIMCDDEAIVAVLKGLIEREDKNDAFANLKMDRLMIFGTEDNYITSDLGKELEKKFLENGVKTEWVEKAGHMSFIEQPKLVCEILDKFILN